MMRLFPHRVESEEYSYNDKAVDVITNARMISIAIKKLHNIAAIEEMVAQINQVPGICVSIFRALNVRASTPKRTGRAMIDISISPHELTPEQRHDCFQAFKQALNASVKCGFYIGYAKNLTEYVENYLQRNNLDMKAPEVKQEVCVKRHLLSRLVRHI